MEPSFPFSFKAVTARAAASSATGLGDNFASPRAARAWSRALLGFAGAPVPRTVCGSRSPDRLLSREVTIFKAEKENDHTSVPKPP